MGGLITRAGLRRQTADVSVAARAPEWPVGRAATSPEPPPLLAGFVAEADPTRVRLWDGSTAWLVTRHDQARDVLRDRRFTAVTSAPGFPMLTRISAVVRAQPASASFIRMDDPDHARLRGMLAREFLARSAEALRPAVRAWLDAAFAPVVASRYPIDLVPTVTDPLPSATIALLLGVPAEETDFFQSRGAVLIDHRTTSAQAVAARDELDDLLRSLIRRRLAEPPSRSDLISRLVADQIAPGNLDLDEAVPMCRLLLLAGHATTANQGSLTLLSVLGDDALRRRLRDEPALIPSAVDELLRLHSIVQNGLARAAVADVRVGGVDIAAGEGVVVSLAAANRDPRVFADPDRLDLDRTPSRHLAFGYGAHRCLGLWLARLELEELISALLRHLPQARLAVAPEQLRFRTQATNFGVLELPVTVPHHDDVPALPPADLVAARGAWIAAALTGTLTGTLTADEPGTAVAGRVVDGFERRWPGGFAGELARWRQLGPFTARGVDVLCHKATIDLQDPTGAGHTATVTCDTSGLVRLVQLSARTPTPTLSGADALDDLARFLRRAGVEGTAAVARIDAAGATEPVWGHRADERSPLGSVSKLYTLLATADAVREGRLHWTTPLTLTRALRSLPTGDTQDLAPGTVLPAATAAIKMIALSDNTAHDLLLDRLGPAAVPAVRRGLGEPADEIFPSTRELFTVGWSGRVDAAQWRAADLDTRRALLRLAAAEPLDTTVASMTGVRHPDGIDWFASPHELIRLWAAVLARAAADPAGVVTRAVTANPGTAAARDHWRWSAFKGGSTPGALNFGWLVRDGSGRGAVLTIGQRSADPELLRDPRPTLDLADQLIAEYLPTLWAGPS